MGKLSQVLAFASAVMAFASTAAAESGSGRFVTVSGGKLWVEACGSGPKTLILLHDGMLGSATWDGVWPTLCKSSHVIRYDRRGFGRSPEGKTNYSAVNDLQSVMHALNVHHAIFVGASSGGGLAIDDTLAHPDEVDGLVLIGPQVSGLPYSQYFIERVTALKERIMQGDLPGAIGASWMFAPGDDANVSRTVKLLAASPQNLSPHDLSTPPNPAAPLLTDIKTPTLVLIGEDDIADNQSQAGIVEYAVHGAKRQVVRNAGHIVYMEQPIEFTRAVNRFINSISDKRPATDQVP